MKIILNVSMLALFVLLVNSSVLPMGITFEFNNKDGISVNGHNINQPVKMRHGARGALKKTTGLGLYFLGLWGGSKIAKRTSFSDAVQEQIRFSTGKLGTLANEALYGELTAKRVQRAGGVIVGGLVGAQCGPNYFIKDAPLFGKKVGKAAVTVIQGDYDETKICAAQAIGAQLGIHLFGKKLRYGPDLITPLSRFMGESLGSGLCATLATSDQELQNYFLKKAVIRAVGLQAISKIPSANELNVKRIPISGYTVSETNDLIDDAKLAIPKFFSKLYLGRRV